MNRRSVNWAFLRGFQVRQNDQPHLDRLRLIATPWFGLYLHRIHQADLDRHPHDHPWPFLSLVLDGGYEEMIFTDQEIPSLGHYGCWNRWSVHRMPMQVAHRITDVKPDTWTLVLTGRRRESWGFWTEHGKVDWEEYLKRGTEVY